jgi:hypothetical protein
MRPYFATSKMISSSTGTPNVRLAKPGVTGRKLRLICAWSSSHPFLLWFSVSRCVMGEDQVVIFDGRVARKAGVEHRLVGGFAILIILSEPRIRVQNRRHHNQSRTRGRPLLAERVERRTKLLGE